MNRFGFQLHIAIALSCAVPATSANAAEPSQQEFSLQLRLETGNAGLQRLELPAVVYEAMQRPDLADLRIFNAAGEPVPIARAEAAAVSARTQEFSAPLFELPATAASAGETTRIRIERRSDGSLLSVTTDTKESGNDAKMWIVDASAHSEPLSALLLGLPQDSNAVDARLIVEASDDLSQWRTVESGAPIIRLAQDGASLMRNRVELRDLRARYLRLRWQSPSPSFAPTSVKLEIADPAPEPEREWRLLMPTHKDGGDYSYVSPGLYPVDRLRIHLPRPNTVAPLSIWSRAVPSQPWHLRASAAVYRLSAADGERSSPDIDVPRVRDPLWQLRLDQRGGGVGNESPQLEIGWKPEEIVFAARGSPPFILAAGSRTARPSLYPLATLMESPTAEKIAALEQVRLEKAANAKSFATPERDRAASAMPWLLWSVLLVALLALGVMARALLRETRAKDKAE